MKAAFLSLHLMLISLLGSFAQDSEPFILTQYYALKDNLIEGNAPKAAASAGEFIHLVKQSSNTGVKPFQASLLADAKKISGTTDLKKQREYFATLSNTMITLAKSVKLDTRPVYVDYCPMKKTYWLSNDKAIKNPYYGAAMLTCGSVSDTFQ